MNNPGRDSSQFQGPKTKSGVVKKQHKGQWGWAVVGNGESGGEEVKGSQTTGCTDLVGPATIYFPSLSSRYLSAPGPPHSTNTLNLPSYRPRFSLSHCWLLWLRPLLNSLPDMKSTHYFLDLQLLPYWIVPFFVYVFTSHWDFCSVIVKPWVAFSFISYNSWHSIIHCVLLGRCKGGCRVWRAEF